jgi:hypothetical protein
MCEPLEWKLITPLRLHPAVEYIRASFESDCYDWSDATSRFCRHSLHPDPANPKSLSDNASGLKSALAAIGQSAQDDFAALLKIGTPPSLFRAYFDLYYEVMKVHLVRGFDGILRIGLANWETLNKHPVDWTASHLQMLLNGLGSSIERWIKDSCDLQELPEPELIESEFEEIVFRRKWRAPKLIYMQPAGNARFDAATAWLREDEDRTCELLQVRSHRFIQFLDITLQEIAGNAHVHMAQNVEYARVPKDGKGQESSSNIESSRDTQQRKTAKPNQATRSRALLSGYRSEVKRGILVQVTKRPDATDLEVCQALDADGAVDLPPSWRLRPSDRLFSEAYSNPRTKRKVEIAISKVRGDLRKRGLLDRR